MWKCIFFFYLKIYIYLNNCNRHHAVGILAYGYMVSIWLLPKAVKRKCGKNEIRSFAFV